MFMKSSILGNVIIKNAIEFYVIRNFSKKHFLLLYYLFFSVTVATLVQQKCKFDDKRNYTQ